jgi:thiamine pyrophosphate-dependent acetolactate synthase large subunit-like protein
VLLEGALKERREKKEKALGRRGQNLITIIRGEVKGEGIIVINIESHQQPIARPLHHRRAPHHQHHASPRTISWLFVGDE